MHNYSKAAGLFITSVILLGVSLGSGWLALTYGEAPNATVSDGYLAIYWSIVVRFILLLIVGTIVEFVAGLFAFGFFVASIKEFLNAMFAVETSESRADI